MKKLIALSCAALLSMGSAAVFADDDVSSAEAARLIEEGKIKSLESLEEKALSVKPGRITDRDLEHEYGRYIYKLDVRADDGTDWDIDIDAATGEVLKTEQDD
ncbi:PepSY domain-containing protein [Pseudomonas sp. MYb185]|uniref:PepSY domain-containing protein n=1 Tax=Pseudomonas sp. MYb185 TaxID=1848729 RepID=UPI000CFD97C5|nr:PepSY domain-containing protein [Pseudomonas sp. MYb185]PRB81307.1 peptidase [Pseudomonas sp. MYb185]